MKSMKFLFITILLLFFIDGGLKAQTVEKTSIGTTNFGVRCNGVIIDHIYGTILQRFLTHYDVDGKVDWIKTEFESINMTSLRNGERFEISFHQKQSGIYINEKIVEIAIHYNCVGEWGSHYIISETFQMDFTNVVPPAQPLTTYIKQECKCW